MVSPLGFASLRGKQLMILAARRWLATREQLMILAARRWLATREWFSGEGSTLDACESGE